MKKTLMTVAMVSILVANHAAADSKIYTENDMFWGDDLSCENDENGQEVLCESPAFDGNTGAPLVGTLQHYDENGTLQWEQEYKNGKKDGYARSYNENGKLIAESQYTHNLRTGKEVTYHPNGLVMSEYRYKDGRLEGKAVRLDDEGTLIAEENYKNGKKDGVQKTYYEKIGILMSEENYINGKRNGIRKIYSKKGLLREEASFKDDYLDGKVKNYDEAGNKVLGVRVFKAGKLISCWIYDEQGNKIIMKIKQENKTIPSKTVNATNKR